MQVGGIGVAIGIEADVIELGEIVVVAGHDGGVDEVDALIESSSDEGGHLVLGATPPKGGR